MTVYENPYRKAPQLALGFDDLVVDNFCGGGGASLGIEAALGRSVDIAINHDQTAISLHTVNHPQTRHYRDDVWQVDPREVCGGRPVGLAWFSPDCRHHSKARGSKPVSKSVRGLAWVARRAANGPAAARHPSRAHSSWQSGPDAASPQRSGRACP